MRIEPRPWFRPAHRRLAYVWFAVRGRRSTVTFPPGAVIELPAGESIRVAGSHLTIAGANIRVVRGS